MYTHTLVRSIRGCTLHLSSRHIHTPTTLLSRAASSSSSPTAAAIDSKIPLSTHNADKMAKGKKQSNGNQPNGGHPARTERKPGDRVLNIDTINPAVIAAEYAVRGEIAIRAEELREECATEEGRKKLGFNEVISCNIGNPQQLEQKPITFFRQVGLQSDRLTLQSGSLNSHVYISLIAGRFSR